MKAHIGLAILAALIVAVALLPRLVRRVDSTVDSMLAEKTEYAALYWDMTNSYRIAAEMPPDHPKARHWRECREKLLAVGYLETRELPLQNRIAAKGAMRDFHKIFQARFPGLECTLRAPTTDAAVAIITAPKSSFGRFGDIERFIEQYRYSAPQ